MTQALLKLVNLFHLLVPIDCEATLVKSDVAITARSITMVLNGARFDNGSRGIISLSSHECRDGCSGCGSVGLEESTVISLDKRVTT